MTAIDRMQIKDTLNEQQPKPKCIESQVSIIKVFSCFTIKALIKLFCLNHHVLLDTQCGNTYVINRDCHLDCLHYPGFGVHLIVYKRTRLSFL